MEGKWLCVCVCGCVCVCRVGFLFGWLVLDKRNLSVITVREQGPVVKRRRGREGTGVKTTEQSFRAGKSSQRERGRQTDRQTGENSR